MEIYLDIHIPYLYVLYRTLEQLKPQYILELGLGQSTKMISQYAAAHPSTQHHIVEHDANWVDFFSKTNSLPTNSIVHLLDLTFVEHENATHPVRRYKDFENEFSGKQFHFISIDAPLGGDMKDLARIDCLDLIPECLSESFAIMIDDFNRHGEQKTVELLVAKLSGAGIDFRQGYYSGEKDLCIIASADNGFLCSM